MFRRHGLSRTLTIAVLQSSSEGRILTGYLFCLMLPPAMLLGPLSTLYSLLLICSSYPRALQIYVLFLCYSLLPAQISYAPRIIFPQLRCTLRVFCQIKTVFFLREILPPAKSYINTLHLHATQS